MQLSWQTIEGFAGISRVGALALLAIFLFLDDHSPDLFSTIKILAKTTTWGIVAEIPAITISFVLGLLLIGTMDSLLNLIYFIESFDILADLVIVSKFNKDVIT